MNTPKKILVVVPRRIGDVLLTTPLIRSLHRAWPEAEIDVLVFAGTEGILANNPDINRVITVAERSPWLEHLRFLLRLLRSYDLALSAIPGDRPTLYARIAGRHCVGPVSAGGNQQWKKWLLSQSVPFDNINTHTVLMNLKLADLLGVPCCHEVVAAWSTNDEDAVRKVLPFEPGVQPYAVLHVHPMYAYKAWRQKAWVELANWLDKQGIRIVLTGGNSADEIAYVRGLMELLPQGSVDVAGKLNLAGVACLLSKAHACIGPDTVITHLAAALGIPTVALFGPSNPVKWGPWPKGYDENRNPYRMRGTQHVNNVVLLQGNGDCVPCMEEGCEKHIASLSDCLQNMPVTSVITALRELNISLAGSK